MRKSKMPAWSNSINTPITINDAPQIIIIQLLLNEFSRQPIASAIPIPVV